MIYTDEMIENMINTAMFHLIGTIDEDTLTAVVRTFPYLKKDSSFWISSAGGDVTEARAIIDLLNYNPRITSVVACGSCQSSAATIFLSADKPKFVTPSTTFMLHQCTMEFACKSKIEYESSRARMAADDEFMMTSIKRGFPDAPLQTVTRLCKEFEKGGDVILTVDDLNEMGIQTFKG